MHKHAIHIDMLHTLLLYRLEPGDHTSLHQVSWCKLELEVGSSKNLSSAPAQSRQDTPPLAVAALNLKIAVNPQVKAIVLYW